MFPSQVLLYLFLMSILKHLRHQYCQLVGQQGTFSETGKLRKLATHLQDTLEVVRVHSNHYEKGVYIVLELVIV